MVRVAGQDAVELAAGADIKLGEDLAQVVLDRARADEQPRADLRVGEPFVGQPRHLGLLGGQRITTGLVGTRADGLPDAPADGLAGGHHLAACPARRRLPAHCAPPACGGALARATRRGSRAIARLGAPRAASCRPRLLSTTAGAWPARPTSMPNPRGVAS